MWTPQSRIRRWVRYVVNSRFFVLAVLVHLAFLTYFGWKKIIPEIRQKKIESSKDGILVKPSKMDPMGFPPIRKRVDPPEPSIPKDLNSGKGIIHVPGGEKWNAPSPDDIVLTGTEGQNISASKNHDRPNSDSHHSKIQINIQEGKNYLDQGIRPTVKNGQRLTPRGDGTARFSTYVMRYSGGDWDCNLGVTDGARWYQSSIQNLMTQTMRWSRGCVNADLVPKPLDLTNDDWIDQVCPPFIFMTGHKDFVWKDQEMKYLQYYLMKGGALWIDSALPGRRSRFDRAVRREVQRMTGRSFEKLKTNAFLFSSKFKFAGVPVGMNGYHEDFEVIRIQGEISVLYSLNDYSDFWEIGLTEKDEIDFESDWSTKFQCWYPRQGSKWGKTLFFKNLNRENVLNAYRLGVNVVYDLLTRFQEKN